MLEEMLKNAKRNARGRRLLTSDQKAVIVQEWEKSGLSCPEFSRRHDLLGGMLYRWRKDAMGERGRSQLINFLPHEKEVLWGRR